MTTATTDPGRPGLLVPLRVTTAWLGCYYPRLNERRFWAVQGLVFGIAGLHAILEATEILEQVSPYGHGLAYVPIALFLVPVIYAALNYGLAGSLPTVVWCAMLAILLPAELFAAELARLAADEEWV